MNRAGCSSCGDVIVGRGDDFVLCGCGHVGIIAGHGRTYGHGLAAVDLSRVADKLVFLLRHAGRHDEAAIVQERRP
jgi:hypothetical protein